jgi:valyl-tRNA synthetase
MVVERQLAAAGNEDRRTMGREAFRRRVWSWKAESGGQITRQLRRLGASCDWSRERFTLDEGLSPRCRRVFVQLHREGLHLPRQAAGELGPALPDRDQRPGGRAARGRRLPTAISPIRWRTAGGFDGEIVVATTRPETMLGDTAWPCTRTTSATALWWADGAPAHRRPPIPIVADAYADPEKGSGAVKITPAHDFNDYQVGKRQGLEVLNILDDRARLNDAVPEEFRAWTASPRARRWWPGWRNWACCAGSSLHATPCRTATAPAP